MSLFSRRPGDGKGNFSAEPPEPLTLPEPADPDYYDPAWDAWGSSPWPFNKIHRRHRHNERRPSGLTILPNPARPEFDYNNVNLDGEPEHGRRLVRRRHRRPPPEAMVVPLDPVVLPEPMNPEHYDVGWDEWKEPRRWPAFVALGAVVALLAGVLVYKSSGTSTTSTTFNPAKFVTPTTFAIATGSGQPADIAFKGTSSSTTPIFQIVGGLSVLRATCDCQGNFGITVTDPTGTIQAIPVNLIGTVMTQTQLNLPVGSYQLQVRSTGPWSVKISQPRNVTPLSLPAHNGSRGNAIIGPYPASTATIVRFGALGSGTPATLSLINPSGGANQLLFSMTKTEVQQVTVPAQSSPYYLQVSTPSYWAVSVLPG